MPSYVIYPSTHVMCEMFVDPFGFAIKTHIITGDNVSIIFAYFSNN